MEAHAMTTKKTKQGVSITTVGEIPCFVRGKLCIEVSPIGPSISGGVSQIEI